jgi:hypothetical protein
LEIEIFHEKNKISNLVESRFAVWNAGTVGFKSSDISTSDPLAISFPGAKILKVVGPDDSRKALGARIELATDNQALLRFEILDPGDAFVFVVYSAVQADSGTKLSALGSVEGALSGLPRGVSKPKTVLRRLSWKFILPLVVFILFGLIVFSRSIVAFTPYEALFSFDPVDVSTTRGLVTGIFGLIFGGLLTASGLYIVILLWRGWRQRPPNFVYDQLLDRKE